MTTETYVDAINKLDLQVATLTESQSSLVDYAGDLTDLVQELQRLARVSAGVAGGAVLLGAVALVLAGVA